MAVQTKRVDGLAPIAAGSAGKGTGKGLHTHRPCQANELSCRNETDDSPNNEGGWLSIIAAAFSTSEGSELQCNA